ncbi:bifunctional diguanylate cyclase/phosphodiesterase [Frateuria terrea]|uniref:Diguanylate cyclase (GGDEF) domain-containing protein n=1 Tax=Frateuria terrea TaxID=529704 RepID=A0A1H6X1X8_9GAMM|nr:EAL domain-containing protein [Frateuria terrea]SEJ19080.1 diguanylate cyclase (GGDEF) domain-containing protein [Frateuria terrea]SFP57299.1 diguanylate cyclase (GGDEF) domain-containing protein [Frateuria terrea]
MNVRATPLPPPRDGQEAWLTRLVGATTPTEVAEVIASFAQALTGCRDVTVAWTSTGLSRAYSSGARAVDHERIGQLHARLALDPAGALIEGNELALRLLLQERAVMLLQLERGQAGEALLAQLQPLLDLAGVHLRRSIRLADLEDSHKQLVRSEALQRALFAISDLAGSDLDMPEMLRRIHSIISTLMYGENFFIVRSDPQQGTMRFLYYADVEDTDAPDTSHDVPLESLRNSMTWHLLTGGKALMGSLEAIRRQVTGTFAPSGPEAIDWLGVPMLRDGQVHGALVVQSYQAGIGFSEDDRALLEFVGSHVLTALERKQSKDELEERVRLRTQELAAANRGLQQEVLERQRAERLQATLFHLAQLATADIDENEFYEHTHAVVGELINAENFFIALLSDDRKNLVFPYYVDAGVRKAQERPLGRGLSEYVLRTGRPLLGFHEDMASLAAQGEIDLLRVGRPAVCWLGVPLRVDEEVIGLVTVQSYTLSVDYDQADQELLTFVAMQIANSIHRRRAAASLQRAYAELELRVAERTSELRQEIIERERIQDQLKHEVMHDALTGLPNRGFLRDRLERVLAILQREPGRRCALLYLDVDRFKVINDSLGHLAGDNFLKAIAQRLHDCVREPDVVARLSGDEFAILLEDIEVPAAAMAVAQRVLEALSVPLQIAGRELAPSASMGIAIGDNTYTTADEVLRDADIALYRAKEQGRNRYELFDETLAKNVVDVLTMEGELRQALQRDEFEPYLQPFCRLEDGAVVGYEALLRWNHPLLGVLGPADFLRVAQDSGHIEAIDWRLFERGCERFLQLPDEDTFLTFNVSALHLRHGDFDARLVHLLERTGLPPWRLIVEVTEGSLLDNPEQVRAMLERLRAIGVGAALDDFGTGYSSLSYLHSLPLRMLKIDRAFVHALGEEEHTTATTVVAAILALARALGIQVIAEGIETPAQRQALLEMGCELGQGYLLGRPAPIGQWRVRERDAE